MKLSNVCDEDLQIISMLKTRKGIATSDARAAQQILRSRHLNRIGYGSAFRTTLDANICRSYKSFAEENGGYTIEEYLEERKRIERERYEQRHRKMYCSERETQ